jgi:hypothetical protein
MIHRLWTWTTLITALEVIVGQLLGSVSPDTPIDRCGRPYPITVWCTDGVEGRPGSLMAVAAIKCGSINPSVSDLSLLIKPTIGR